MSRRIVGYTASGATIWEDLGPAEHVVRHGFSHLGGRAIEPAILHRPTEPTSVKHLQQKIRRMRGTEPGAKA